jgi:hypothetical protein
MHKITDEWTWGVIFQSLKKETDRIVITIEELAYWM